MFKKNLHVKGFISIFVKILKFTDKLYNNTVNIFKIKVLFILAAPCKLLITNQCYHTIFCLKTIDQHILMVYDGN
jgi:hypothetical protein